LRRPLHRVLAGFQSTVEPHTAGSQVEALVPRRAPTVYPCRSRRALVRSSRRALATTSRAVERRRTSPFTWSSSRLSFPPPEQVEPLWSFAVAASRHALLLRVRLHSPRPLSISGAAAAAPRSPHPAARRRAAQRRRPARVPHGRLPRRGRQAWHRGPVAKPAWANQPSAHLPFALGWTRAVPPSSQLGHVQFRPKGR
jgi:hypothetical protein